MRKLHLSILLSASLLILSGCGGLTPSPNEQKKVDATLPVVTLTQSGVITDMTSVAFEWKSVADPRVKSIGVYRTSASDTNQSELTYYDTLNSRFRTHYVDSDVKPDTRYSYAFRVFTKESQGKLSKVYKVNTKPVLQSVAWIHSITGLPRSAKIIWRPHTNKRVEKYIIERKTLEDEEWETIDTLDGRLNAEYIDGDLADNHVYMYRVRVKTYDGIVSTPSQIVKVVTKPLPQSVTHIEVSKNLPKKIQIAWVPTQQKDFSRYYLYRSDSVDGNYELIAKLHNPTFTDTVDEDGARYFYRVSVVDKDGLESEHEKLSVMGMTLAKPTPPAVFDAKYTGTSIVLQWSKVDPRSKSYQIKREAKKGWFDTQTKWFKNVQGTQFVDKQVELGTTYTYTVYSVDAHGIVSNPSMNAIVVTPESQETIAPQESQTQPQQVQKSTPAQEQQSVAPAEELELNNL